MKQEKSQQPKSKNNIKRMSLRLPFEIWCRCRHAQEAGLMGSINGAALISALTSARPVQAQK